MTVLAVGTLKDAITKLLDFGIVVTETEQNRTQVGNFVYNGSIELFAEGKEPIGVFMPHGGWLKINKE